MKGLLEKSEYAFIKTNPDLQNIIYLTLSGSHAYGTSTENSDYDLRGVLRESDKYIYGLKSFEQFEDLPTDTVIYGIKKFAELLSKGNPNAIELLGVEEESIVLATEHGKLLRDNTDLFLSKRVADSFGNYALAQLHRLRNALCHDSYTSEERQQHLQAVLSSQISHFQQKYTEFPGGAISIYGDEDELKFDITLKNYPISDFAGIYNELANIIKTYNKLTYRNKKKSEQGLFKHAMHLIRLLATGTDILAGKGVITRRKAEHGLLMDIRGGKIPFDEIFDLAKDFKQKFELAAKYTSLPAEPDLEKIERLMMKMYGI
ncbi:MAG: nucleotidyltransferase domain-containing protein [Spirochaetes bacterium]|nr:nucleotidyltransferase domain-containing protein [Spirochaetota bacterium]